MDIPMGAYRWLTVVAPDRPDGPELVLEPNAHPAARAYQDALLRDGIPVNFFEVDDVEAEHRRLRERGVEFTRPPTDAGPVRIATRAGLAAQRQEWPRPWPFEPQIPERRGEQNDATDHNQRLEGPDQTTGCDENRPCDARDERPWPTVAPG
jgi:hypothetical protein